MSLFFCGVVFSFPRLQYKNPSTCSIFFRLPLLEKISPNRLVCVFFWVAVIAKLQEEENRFFLPLGRAFFRSETPDSALLRYLLQDILSHLPAFLVVLAILFRLGIFVRQWDPKRFVFLLCTKGFCCNHEYPDFFIFWLAQTTYAEQSGLLLPRTYLLSFRVVFPAVLWRIQLRVCLLRFPKLLSGETLLLCAPEWSETFL